MWLLCKIVNTIVGNNVCRKIGELLKIILKNLAFDLADSVKNPHLGSKKRSIYLKYKSKFLVVYIYDSLIIIALHPMEC